MQEKRFAILIDGDNTSSKHIKTIIDEITKEGIITYNRIYGDFTSTRLDKWKSTLLEYSITPMQQYSYTSGKNSTDSAMIIDAMDILYTGGVDGFCLASSDSDFTKLAVRLKEAGKIVIGMGKKQTPKPFVRACSQFKYVDLISEENTEQCSDIKEDTYSKQKLKSSKAKSNAKKINTIATESKIITENTFDNKITVDDTADSKPSIDDITQIKTAIDDIIDENANAEGYVLASVIGTKIQQKYNDFDCRNYKFKKLIDMLEYLNYDKKLNKDKSTYYIKKKDISSEILLVNNQIFSPIIKPSENQNFDYKTKENIRKIIADCSGEDGKAQPNRIGKALKANNINYKDFGFVNLKNLIKSLNCEITNMKNKTYYVKLKK